MLYTVDLCCLYTCTRLARELLSCFTCSFSLSLSLESHYSKLANGSMAYEKELVSSLNPFFFPLALIFMHWVKQSWKSQASPESFFSSFTLFCYCTHAVYSSVLSLTPKFVFVRSEAHACVSLVGLYKHTDTQIDTTLLLHPTVLTCSFWLFSRGAVCMYRGGENGWLVPDIGGSGPSCNNPRRVYNLQRNISTQVKSSQVQFS